MTKSKGSYSSTKLFKENYYLSLDEKLHMNITHITPGTAVFPSDGFSRNYPHLILIQSLRMSNMTKSKGAYSITKLFKEKYYLSLDEKLYMSMITPGAAVFPYDNFSRNSSPFS